MDRQDQERVRILVFDPGETTGVAMLACGEEDEEASILYTDVIDWWHGAAEKIKEWAPDVIVVEDFVLYPGTAKFLGYSHMPAAQVIGVLRYLGEQTGIPVVMQLPNVKEAVRTDLSAIRTEHARDAVRHGAYYFAQKANERKK